ncbi:MAG: nucleotidyltransferase domain-containing protein [Ruminococcaceae bacterium]|nr:nucleotidyltransferase domain-containing protein [Oscillospiraceae bacterium]
MINISLWTDEFLKALADVFGDRLWFVGLQGSYARGEATESSDIDLVVILDELSPADIYTYNSMLDTLPDRELVCGFLSGKEELLNWEPSDLFQFYYDTKPLKGSLDGLLSLIDDASVSRAIKAGVCNIYHGCVHNMLYEKSEDVLRGLYKSASFVIQAVCFKESGKYVSRLSDLTGAVSADDRIIIEIFMKLKNGGEVNLREMSDTLYNWSVKLIKNKM